MPIPKPKKDDSKNKFISRCMGSEVMQKEFKDKQQRAAVCYRQWRKGKEQ